MFNPFNQIDVHTAIGAGEVFKLYQYDFTVDWKSKSWFERHADYRNPDAFVHRNPWYFAQECAAAIVNHGKLVHPEGYTPFPALSEVPFDNLKVNDRVISALGKPGRIIQIDNDQHNPHLNDEDRKYVWIQWEGKADLSHNSHYTLNAVLYVGQ